MSKIQKNKSSKILQFPGNNKEETNTKTEKKNYNVPKVLFAILFDFKNRNIIKERLKKGKNLIYLEDLGKVKIWEWKSKNKDIDGFAGSFYLYTYEDKLQFETPYKECFQEAKDFIKTLFGTELKKISEDEVNLEIELIKRITKDFLSKPIDKKFNMNGLSPLEVEKNEINMMTLEEYIRSVEVKSIFADPNDPINMINYNYARNLLGLKISREGKIRDSVEDTLVNKSIKRFSTSDICYAMHLWRNMKDILGFSEEKRDYWVASLEFLLNQIYYSGKKYTKKDIAKNYNVKIDDLELGYRKIVNTLYLEVPGS